MERKSFSLKRIRFEYVWWMVIFGVVFAWRWWSLKPLLPEEWQVDDKIAYTILIKEKPSYLDTKTVVREGRWQFVWWGYQPLKVGQRYRLVGEVEPRLKLGKQVAVKMVNPKFEVVKVLQGPTLSLVEQVVLGLGRFRERIVDNFNKWLPEPQSSLASGILLGVKREMPKEFYQQLIKTGTVHIVAASGYNVTVVAGVVMGMLLLVFPRGVAIVGGILAIVAYVIVAGGSAAVVRSAVMGCLALLAYYGGRETEVKRLLWITVGLMLWVQPLMLVDVGFQLSVSATAGLLYLEPWLQKRFKSSNKQIKSEINEELKIDIKQKMSDYLDEYWWPTVAASLATLPVIYLTFGRVSWISPIVNLLVLPLTPLIMLLSAIASGVGALIPSLGQVASWVLYLPLEWMVQVIRLF